MLRQRAGVGGKDCRRDVKVLMGGRHRHGDGERDQDDLFGAIVHDEAGFQPRFAVRPRDESLN